jgi:hypothetical protein
VLERFEVNVERQEGRRLQRGERPFIGIRDERYWGMLEHVRRVGYVERLAGHFRGGDDEVTLRQPPQDSGVADELVVGPRGRHDRPEDLPVSYVDVPARIPE